MVPDMASPAHELTLDFKPSTTYASAFQKPHGDQHALQQNQKIHEFLTRLEEERRKIDAFKRELPLCMQLLNNAIEIYKQQLEAFHRTGDGHAQRPVLEEFIPLKQMDGDGGADPKAAAPPSEKANWMVSAQLWSPVFDEAKPLAALAPPREAEHGAAGGFDVSGSPKLALDSKQRNGGAFLPFSKEKNKTSSCSVRAANPRALPELALASAPDKPIEEKKKYAELEVNGSRENNCTNGKGGSTTEAQGVAAALATHRKARRCWSPDLHRRFVNALQILGGSQVATPKQIRELMKVDGLTNDEVKSHLQKYRLHTRRPPPAPAASAAAAPQLVVLGGIWVPQEFATPAGGASAIYSAAHAAAASAHYCAAAPPVPQEFYPLPQQTVAAQHHLHAPGAYKVRASPEFEVRSDGVERCESVEEEGEEGKEEVEDEEEEEGEETPEKEMARAESGGVALKF